ncbi:MAG: formyltetrahydrofolate deformylase [Actinomycetota bacterium]|jgi:formyltetrahydrofolate deformylase|nr:formyltetrahydrofolate deformylase [Actinomycetota bacterium]
MGPRKSPHGEVIVTLRCPDRVGIVRAVAGFLADRDVNILESQQFADPSTDQFFMRVQAGLPDGLAVEALREEFTVLAARFEMAAAIHDARVRSRVLILVSRLGHCLNDLLYRQRIGALVADFAGVVSNHPDFEDLARSYGVPFIHLPVTPGTKVAQEEKLRSLVDELDVDLILLARYMQILSPPTVEHFEGRAINIHHSFLPSFKGARPYQQAYERGVKLIGATAHYVTSELDEGPIIEQEVARVDHNQTPDELAAVGRDIECVAFARAARWHLEHRVMLNDKKTVVFR